ncbi:L-type lectin-domain containing receptor kinase S.6-like [Arachis duranensis]|uniref:L-type lectin-domain containing receptor kinase S.6-like n=1 Tax=Arachis duranensis TaxID=130453 RepID=A0A9C6TR54_ARADU|nr:L-type lectin-domain containing receptor kinase S.6-like [Arachis duranensis]
MIDLVPVLCLRGGMYLDEKGSSAIINPLSAVILDQPQYQDSFFAVEIDTSFDSLLGNINTNHIGIDLSTIVSFSSVDTLSPGVDFKSGKVVNAWIEYRDSMKMVCVWVSYSSTSSPTPILASQVDFSEQLKEFMHVGFSTSNGGGSGIHVIDHWQFIKTLDYGSREEVTPMDTIEEGNCLLSS